MPPIYSDSEYTSRHTEDIQDIISSVPSWLLRWGTLLFFVVIIIIIGLSAVIKYPDIVREQLKISSPNSPKPITAKINGKLIKLLVKENELVMEGRPLAFLESTGNHLKVLRLLNDMKYAQKQVIEGHSLKNSLFRQTDNDDFGELQAAYQTFFQEFTLYKSSTANGFLLKKKEYLKNALVNLRKQQEQLNAQKLIQQRDLKLGEDEYKLSQKLLEERAETPSNVKLEESKYLSKKSPLIQTEAAIIAANTNFSGKQKEIMELENEIIEEKGKFLQALNSLISSAEEWKNKYVLSASQAGKISFAGIVQENEVLSANEEVFFVNPGNEEFFGEMAIQQNNMGKIKEGQEVLIKLKSYPFEEYGIVKGRVSYISEIPYKDSVFMSKVTFKLKNSSDLSKPIHLKQGMMADAEIITRDATLLQRLIRSFIKILSYK